MPGCEVIRGPSIVDTFVIQDLQQDIRSGWQPFVPMNAEGQPRESKRGIFFVDDEQEPRYIAKLKFDAHQVREAREGSLPLGFNQLDVSNRNSILNEWIASWRIARAVENDFEIQEIVQTFGFLDVSVCEPIAGCINRLHRYKAMVYPWIPNPHDAHNTNGEEFTRFSKVSDAMYSRVYNLAVCEGIIPRDFGMIQLISSQNELGERLYITDTEGYARVHS